MEFWRPDVEALPPEKLRAHQEKLLLEYVKYAYEHSPYYRRQFDERGLRPEDIKNLDDFFEKVPMISKLEIIENEREKPPFGEFLAVPPDEVVRIFISPGPIFYPLTKDELENAVEMCAACFYTCGVRAGDVVDVAFAYNWVPAGTVFDDACRRIGAAVIPAGTGFTDMHIQVMRAASVTAFVGTPSFLMQIGKRAQELGLKPKQDLRLRVGVFTGEAVPDSLKRELNALFGLAPMEIYAAAEVGIMARECPAAASGKVRGLHIYEDIVLELIDPKTGEHVPPGEPGEVVATFLQRRSMPLLRYRTGDLAAGLEEGVCECGRSSSRLLKIVGRVSDVVKVRGMFVVPSQVESVLRRHPELGRFQMVIERPATLDELTIVVESKDRSEELRKTLESELKEVIKLRASVEFVDKLYEDAKLVVDKREFE